MATSCPRHNANVQTAKNESPWSSAREHCCKWRRTVWGDRARKAIVDCDLFPPLSLTSSRGTASSDTGEWEDCLRRWLKVVDFSWKLTYRVRVYAVYMCACAFVHAYATRCIGGVTRQPPISKVVVDIFRLLFSPVSALYVKPAHITSIHEETHAKGLFDKTEGNLSLRMKWSVDHLELEILEKIYEVKHFFCEVIEWKYANTFVSSSFIHLRI